MTITQEPALRGYSQLLIGGKWVDPSSDKRIDIINPYAEQVIAHVPAAQNADVD